MVRLKVYLKIDVLTINNIKYFDIVYKNITFADEKLKNNEMENVYPLLKFEGMYDTSTTSVVAVFRDKEMAKNEAERLNNEMEILKKKVDKVFFNENKNRDTLGTFGDFIDNEVIILILKNEHPDYYDFYVKTDYLNDVLDSDKEREIASKIDKLLYDDYLNDVDKLCQYASAHYNDKVVNKIRLYFEYKNNCTNSNFYEGLPSYYASEESIPIY